MPSILITGATGHVGRELARILTAGPHAERLQVRALVRDLARAADLPPSVERVVGDVDRPDTLRAALDGVDRLYLMDPSHAVAFTTRVVDAARDAGVRLVVDQSSLGAALRPMPRMGRWFAAREAVVRASGIAWTLLRPGNFMSNALAWARSIREEGVVRDPIGPGRIASIDPADIAAVAAVALTRDGHVGAEYTLTGGELTTVREQVATLARVLGRPIEYVEVSPEDAARALAATGAPTEVADAVRDLNELFRRDGAAVLTDTVERLTGQRPGSFERWCRRHAAAFA